jgi:hypothetical protein
LSYDGEGAICQVLEGCEEVLARLMAGLRFPVVAQFRWRLKTAGN